MYPLGPQSLEVVLALSVSVTVGAPDREATRTTLPSFTNPTRWPSGEKKGLDAPCVPAIGVASSWSSRRSQSWEPPSAGPRYASARPSGDRAMRPPPDGLGGCSAWLFRSARLNLLSGSTGVGRSQPHSAAAVATTSATLRASTAARGRRLFAPSRAAGAASSDTVEA